SIISMWGGWFRWGAGIARPRPDQGPCAVLFDGVGDPPRRATECEKQQRGILRQAQRLLQAHQSEIDVGLLTEQLLGLRSDRLSQLQRLRRPALCKHLQQ